MNSMTLHTMLSSKNLLPLMAGAVSIALSIGSMLPVAAQTTTPNAPNAPTERPQQPKPNFLNLTSEQQAQMKQIMESSRAQIDAILTAEQKAQLQAAKANRPNFRPDGNGTRPNLTAEQKAQMRANRGDRGPGGFGGLNLTAEQKAQIDAVMQSTKAQMDAVLTPEQRQQKQQFEQQHQQRRQSRGQKPQTSLSGN